MFVCLFVYRHVFSRTVAAVDTKRGYVGMCKGARHSKSLERRSQRTACSRGRLKFTYTFLVKAESGGYQTWIYYVGRCEERLTQQESGAA